MMLCLNVQVEEKKNVKKKEINSRSSDFRRCTIQNRYSLNLQLFVWYESTESIEKNKCKKEEKKFAERRFAAL